HGHGVRRNHLVLSLFFFFFSSRRRHTRFSRDWSSDVCSSDFLGVTEESDEDREADGGLGRGDRDHEADEDLSLPGPEVRAISERSEERRVGKEGRGRWGGEH